MARGSGTTGSRERSRLVRDAETKPALSRKSAGKPVKGGKLTPSNKGAGVSRPSEGKGRTYRAAEGAKRTATEKGESVKRLRGGKRAATPARGQAVPKRTAKTTLKQARASASQKKGKVSARTTKRAR